MLLNGQPPCGGSDPAGVGGSGWGLEPGWALRSDALS